ncbi:MAG: hypothetical protein Q8R34_02050 [bacterium]|nr:hypothetical protein [bacterium]
MQGTVKHSGDAVRRAYKLMEAQQRIDFQKENELEAQIKSLQVELNSLKKKGKIRTDIVALVFVKNRSWKVWFFKTPSAHFGSSFLNIFAAKILKLCGFELCCSDGSSDKQHRLILLNSQIDWDLPDQL